MYLAPLIAVPAIFGLLIGSFLNVVIWRVPRGESIVHPPSHCPNCDHAIRWYDNIPVFSWLVLRGRCRDCGTPISVRYPAVELGTGVAFGVVGLWFALARMSLHPSITAGAFELFAMLYLAAVSIALTLIDLDLQRLPNAIVYPSYAVMVVLLGLSSVLDGDLWALLRAVIGGVGLFAVYFILAVAYPGGMGFGDVKLAGVLGFSLAWLGWGTLAVGAFTPFLLGGLFGVVLLLVRRAGRKSRIPFGPWMLGGAWIGVLFGTAVSNWYLGMFGIA